MHAQLWPLNEFRLTSVLSVELKHQIKHLVNNIGGVARMSDPKMISEIQKAVTIPVMAKVRIGHFVEAEVFYCLCFTLLNVIDITSIKSRFYR